ncbi:hypothetical protein CB0940_06185 [Cercospora beticola]|uniref:PARG catalytic Macro domain-containing protein n=1 Tax=Cercospora beticola TaxID=122368 RepID=A0A2G5HYC8_CERBT|nr:hypothetical protein CB0940_06185 [Cercospora beticola]PIA97252.1 hypothetical protein CB0940_06185 [Cercospora beticola]WPA98801.1 hypothetical protein RHO25_003414 [Cercospora beticola]
MEAEMSHYLLPDHASRTSLDPLGICDDGEDVVNQFRILEKLLCTAESAFDELNPSKGQIEPHSEQAYRSAFCRLYANLLKDIAYSLHEDGSLDTTGAEALIASSKMTVTNLSKFGKAVCSNALAIGAPESSFADGKLQQLCADVTFIRLDSKQVDMLLAHMLLGTLSKPPGNEWGRPGFAELFSNVGETAQAYLQTLFEHFAEGGYTKTDPTGSATFHLHNSTNMPDLITSHLPAPRLPIRIVDKPSENSPPDYSPNHYILVAAHSQPGPGPKGTQEERLIGQSPALALMSLLKPILGPDEVVITSNLWAHSSWSGHGREAKMTKLFPSDGRPRNHYIFADALELDMQDSADGVLPDLKPENIEREVRKLYAAFAGTKAIGGRAAMKIQIVPWGCGAFGGDFGVKTQCMMMAAGLAGLESSELELVITKDREEELRGLVGGPVTVREIYEHLTAPCTVQA